MYVTYVPESTGTSGPFSLGSEREPPQIAVSHGIETTLRI
jgi:hypothetical protein